MIPFEMLDDAIAGTRWEWVALVVLLPFVGRGVARTWGRGGVLAAQRALLVLLADFGYGLVLALPTYSGAFLVAALPVVGAAFSRMPATLCGRPLAWLGAAAFALPAISVNHMGPGAWGPWWLIVLFAAVAARGMVDALADRLEPLVRRWWTASDTKTTVK